MKLKYFHDKDPWILGEDIPNADLFFSNIWLYGFVNFFAKHTGRTYKKIVCKYEGGYHLWFYFGEKDSYEVGENIANKIINQTGYAEKINKNIILQADILRRFSENIPQKNLNKLSERGLWQIYDKHNKIHSEYYTWCWIPVAADMFHSNLTKKIKDYLKTLNIKDEKINEYFIILTQPIKKSLIFIEQEDILKLAIKIAKYKRLILLMKTKDIPILKINLPKNILKLLEQHWKKYYYTKHLWVSGEYALEDYIIQLKEIFHEKESPKVILKKINAELKKSFRKRQKLIQELSINKKWVKILDAFGDFMVTKIYRRYAQLLAVHHMSVILKEIARRKFITEKQVRCMLPWEVKNMLLYNKHDENELLPRTKFMVRYGEKGVDILLVGEKAHQYMKKVEKGIDTNVKELHGDTACVGYAKGIVKIIIRAEDMKKMNKGDILVSIATDPDIVPAMKKAAAIVTEQGGVTSHAAIVSRELGIPCVIGTKIATRVLKDGDRVEVDAERGVVKIIEK